MPIPRKGAVMEIMESVFWPNRDQSGNYEPNESQQ